MKIRNHNGADNHGMRRFSVLALIAATVMGARVFAQNDRVPLQLMPQPNQVIHITMDQAAEMQVDGASMSLQVRTSAAMTQAVGARDANGRLSSSVTYDRFA